MKLAGVLLDQHDDPTAVVVQARLAPEEVPEIWKTASLPDPSLLLDEEFALVLQDGRDSIRKYACSDEVSTAISSFYFMNCGGKLPLEAQKTAALNLASSLQSYGLGIPTPIKKLAMAKLRAIGRISSGRIGQLGPKGVSRIGKTGPKTGPSKLDPDKLKSTGKAQFSKVSNVVDIRGEEAPTNYVNRPRSENPNDYAIVKEGSAQYPIDTFDRLQRAVEYYQQYEDRFDLDDRRQYCTKVANKAHLLSESVPESMLRYVTGSNDSDSQALEVGLYHREKLASNPDHKQMIRGIREQAETLHPEYMVGLLTEFDKVAGLVDGWDRIVPNPVASVYKTAAAETADEILIDEAGVRLSASRLKAFIRQPEARQHLERSLSMDLADGMIKDPVVIYKSLPDAHKIIIARMALDNMDGRDPAHPA